MFVVFLMTLFAFGQAAAVRVHTDKGYALNFNALSCLGVVSGVLALLLLPWRLRTILRGPKVKAVLGLIGGVGLITHLVLAVMAGVPWVPGWAPPAAYRLLPPTSQPGAVKPRPAGVEGNKFMAWSGQETWDINGRAYEIRATYYLGLPAGLQYTIEYPYAGADAIFNDAEALKVAWPVIRHAYEAGLYKRAKIIDKGGRSVPRTRIGVTLLKEGGGMTKGYRVGLSLEEIRRRSEASGS